MLNIAKNLEHYADGTLSLRSITLILFTIGNLNSIVILNYQNSIQANIAVHYWQLSFLPADGFFFIFPVY